MIKNNSFYKSRDLNNKGKRDDFFNPYGYNLESNLKDSESNYLLASRTKSHEMKKEVKK